jgi:hypothetical protein
MKINNEIVDSAPASAPKLWLNSPPEFKAFRKPTKKIVQKVALARNNII